MQLAPVSQRSWHVMRSQHAELAADSNFQSVCAPAKLYTAQPACITQALDPSPFSYPFLRALSRAVRIAATFRCGPDIRHTPFLGRNSRVALCPPLSLPFMVVSPHVQSPRTRRQSLRAPALQACTLLDKFESVSPASSPCSDEDRSKPPLCATIAAVSAAKCRKVRTISNTWYHPRPLCREKSCAIHEGPNRIAVLKHALATCSYPCAIRLRRQCMVQVRQIPCTPNRS